MSRGLGRVERQVLVLLKRGGELKTVDLAAGVYAIATSDQVTAAQHAAVRRALASLQRKGPVGAIARSDGGGKRRYWGVPVPRIDGAGRRSRAIGAQGPAFH